MERLTRILFASALAVTMAAGGCILSPEESVEPPPPPKKALTEKPLTTRSNVVNNLAFAYDNRQIDTYTTLLDAQFTFIFQAGDVTAGTTPASWVRDDEIAATANLFNENFSDPIQPPAETIELQIFGLESLSDDKWVIFPEDQKPFPDPNTWWEWSQRYKLDVRVGEDLLTADDRVRFVVRPVDVGGKTEWRLVLWEDLEQI